ncbi:MAG: ATPase [Nitrospirae bacterium CG18_big_fil_WC_8_21_14_2_50_70_55]|nr:ATPase [Deltaproteobacteria bacterium]PIQ04341.1 MAG: ATPase [Nitrospirae bacterium CG18_big_fil_WC_8_21_14_2_50_70_55]PIW82445.1 MAG: ATPase [Nitrospirae bacterium CG_4_8_14_3_um_filter_70_85]PIX83551.1 MAG: ATPase [Nitrospirae bacterium CG_4_10_14_3_um_filter_70_108]PJB95463.1 MAG: ATPase [Nitrospirae bacterium CG_4_9_14_0_8_um_filter_70_14]
MSLRPRPARWFELVVVRGEAMRAAASLAATGAMEVEALPGAPLHGASLTRSIARFRDLARRHGRYWPAVEVALSPLTRSPRPAVAAALRRLARWEREGEATIRLLQGFEAERDRLRLWQTVAGRLGASGVEVAGLLAAGPALAVEVALLPAVAARLGVARPILTLQVALDSSRTAVVLVGPPPEVAREVSRLVELRGRLLTRLAWPGGEELVGWLAARLATVEGEIERAYVALFALAERLDLAAALADLTTVAWFVERVGPVAATPLFLRLTGWTSDPAALVRALEWDGVAALLTLPQPPAGVRPPSLLVNPPWVRPFELFAQALGTPGEGEVDPSPLLAVVVPLLFGYMFGDVGQGLVLAALGIGLWRRGPVARLLAAGGVAAALFGLLFGSLFCRVDLLSPLWLHPLDQPIALLVFPIVAAVLLLAGGLCLAGLEAVWVGEGGRWLREEGALLFVYLGLAGGIAFRPLFGLAVVGALYHLAVALLAGGGAGAAVALGRLVEEGQRLGVNTLSFARVGAFALAHAGLASVVVTLAHAAGPLAPLVWVVGNAAVIVLEGLIVSIQTTRLVLFEFFARFLRGEGRPFQPLTPPTLAEVGHGG